MRRHYETSSNITSLKVRNFKVRVAVGPRYWRTVCTSHVAGRGGLS